jgi:hypothetical protein
MDFVEQNNDRTNDTLSPNNMLAIENRHYWQHGWRWNE